MYRMVSKLLENKQQICHRTILTTVKMKTYVSVDISFLYSGTVG